jgi:micrococcal nuclease
MPAAALILCGCVVLLGSLVACSASASRPLPTLPAERLPDQTQGARVLRVLDGQTFIVESQGRTAQVRVLGLSAPTLATADRPAACYSGEALARARALLEGQQVTLAADASQPAQDRLGRLLAHVWLPDGQFFGAVMLEDGFGRATARAAHRYADEYQRVQAEARAGLRGLWGACETATT